MSIIILVMGLPGTGKTTIAKKIAQRLKVKRVDSDTVKRKVISKLMGKKRFKQFLKRGRRLSFHLRMKVYKVMAFQMNKFLSQNKNVVCTGTFYSKKLRKIFYDFFKKNNIKFYIIEVVCPEDILEKRIIKRLKITKRGFIATWDIYKKEKRLWKPVKKKHFIIDSSKNIDKQVNKFLKDIMFFTVKR